MGEATSPSRRGLMRTAGAGAMLGALGVGAPSAMAEDGPGSAGRQAAPPSGATSIGSPPVSGRTYRSAAMLDFTPENWAAGRAWGGSGSYTPTSSSWLWAYLDVPAGALVRDIEWYVRNASAGSVPGLNRLWTPGSAHMVSIGDTTIATSTAVTATRTTTTSSTWGPYPTGTTLALGIETPTDGSVQVNGVRVGFSHGVGQTGLLPAPVRIFNSRTGSRLSTTVPRKITVPGSIFTPGVTAIIANVTIVSPVKAGWLTVWPVGASQPNASHINFGVGETIANAGTIAVNAAGEFYVRPSASCHVLVDVTGIVG